MDYLLHLSIPEILQIIRTNLFAVCNNKNLKSCAMCSNEFQHGIAANISHYQGCQPKIINIIKKNVQIWLSYNIQYWGFFVCPLITH